MQIQEWCPGYSSTGGIHRSPCRADCRYRRERSAGMTYALVSSAINVRYCRRKAVSATYTAPLGINALGMSCLREYCLPVSMNGTRYPDSDILYIQKGLFSDSVSEIQTLAFPAKHSSMHAIEIPRRFSRGMWAVTERDACIPRQHCRGRAGPHRSWACHPAPGFLV